MSSRHQLEVGPRRGPKRQYIGIAPDLQTYIFQIKEKTTDQHNVIIWHFYARPRWVDDYCYKMAGGYGRVIGGAMAIWVSVIVLYAEFLHSLEF